jgi:hypothetical protein
VATQSGCWGAWRQSRWPPLARQHVLAPSLSPAPARGPASESPVRARRRRVTARLPPLVGPERELARHGHGRYNSVAQQHPASAGGRHDCHGHVTVYY